MKFGVSLVIGGIIILIFGVIFHLQGNAVLGPESSFMYSNPEWISYGLWIGILGLSVAAVGIFFVFKRV